LSGRSESRGVYFWLLGSLAPLPWALLGKLAALSVGVVGLLFFLAPALNLLALGRESAQALGLNAGRATWAVLLLSAAAAGLAVTFNGMIPFVGLLVPHGARALVGGDQRRVLPVAALMGAGVTALADALGRAATAPVEIPTGVVAALAGAPFFLILLRR